MICKINNSFGEKKKMILRFNQIGGIFMTIIVNNGLMESKIQQKEEEEKSEEWAIMYFCFGVILNGMLHQDCHFLAI